MNQTLELEINGTPPKLSGLMCDAFICESFACDGKMIATANVSHISFGDLKNPGRFTFGHTPCTRQYAKGTTT